MVYEDFNDLPRRTIADKILRDKAFNIAKNPKMTDIKTNLLQWFLNSLIKSLLTQTKEEELIMKASSFRLSYTIISKRITQTNY